MPSVQAAFFRLPPAQARRKSASSVSTMAMPFSNAFCTEALLPFEVAAGIYFNDQNVAHSIIILAFLCFSMPM